MKLIILIVYLMCISYKPFAQSDQFSITAGFKELVNNTSFIFSFNDKQNEKVFMLMNTKDSVKCFVISEYGAVLNQFAFQKSSARMIPLGGYFSTDKVTVLFAKHTSDQYIYTYSYNFLNSKIDSSI